MQSYNEDLYFQTEIKLPLLKILQLVTVDDLINGALMRTGGVLDASGLEITVKVYHRFGAKFTTLSGGVRAL